MTIFVLLLLGCSQKEINYYSNPYVVSFQETIDTIEIEDYQLTIVDGKLIIKDQNKKFEVSLPDNHKYIQSFVTAKLK